MNKGLFFLFLIVFFGSFVGASTITVYEDDFNGIGDVNLHGLPPDIDNNGGNNTWIAHTGWKADGTPGAYSSATLPFTPVVGKVYRLSARFKNVVGNNDWLAIGFAAGSSTGNTSNGDRFIEGATAGQPWMLRRGNAATSADQTFAGPGTANGQDISSTLNRSSDVDFQIILDTRPAQWQAVWYQKLTSEPEYSIVLNFKYSINPSIGAVGLACANIGTTGNIDYFLLEEIDADLCIVAHWSMNQTDYDGNYVDTVEGYIAHPTSEPNFITGVRDEPNGAVMIAPSTGWGLSEAFEVDLTEGFTICLWVNWNGDWQEQVTIDDLEVESSGSGYVVENGIRADQRWQHVCITYDNSTVRVYLNGRLKLSEMWELPVSYEAAIEIGNTLGQQIFNGAIDDILLYNYALGQTEITQIVTGDGNCVQEYDLEYDLSGPYGLPDCTVSLYDLAGFPEHWLENCLPEYSLEYDFSGPYGLPDCTVNLYDLAEFSKHWLSSGW